MNIHALVTDYRRFAPRRAVPPGRYINFYSTVRIPHRVIITVSHGIREYPIKIYRESCKSLWCRNRESQFHFRHQNIYLLYALFNHPMNIDGIEQTVFPWSITSHWLWVRHQNGICYTRFLNHCWADFFECTSVRSIKIQDCDYMNFSLYLRVLESFRDVVCKNWQKKTVYSYCMFVIYIDCLSYGRC